MLSMAGMNPMHWLMNADPFERRVMQEIAQRRADLAADEREDLAVRIVNQLARSMKK